MQGISFAEKIRLTKSQELVFESWINQCGKDCMEGMEVSRDFSSGIGPVVTAKCKCGKTVDLTEEGTW